MFFLKHVISVSSAFNCCSNSAPESSLVSAITIISNSLMKFSTDRVSGFDKKKSDVHVVTARSFVTFDADCCYIFLLFLTLCIQLCGCICFIKH